MLTVKAKIPAVGAHWQGEIFGWQAEYNPESDRKPEDSNMTFTQPIFGSAKAPSGSSH